MALSKEQIEKFKSRLLVEKEDIEKEITNISSNQTGSLVKTAYPDFHNVPGAQDENMDEVEAYDNLLSVHRHLNHRLEEIKKALEHINKGSYGFCDNCQEEIPLQRLEVNPSATSCVKCSNK